MNGRFLPLPLNEWRDTRDALHGYARVLGKVRRTLSPPHELWWHVSLGVADTGLSTGEIRIDRDGAPGRLECLLDLDRHDLAIRVDETVHRGSFPRLSIRDFCGMVLETLAAAGIEPEIDRSAFDDPGPLAYDPAKAERYLAVLRGVHDTLGAFRRELEGETSPVQLWPHHFDLALSWFSGRLVPGVDPENAEEAKESLTFGFSTGDEGVPDPYFYGLAHPLPAGLADAEWPEGISWRTEGWQGAFMPYSVLTDHPDPEGQLLTFLRAHHRAAARLMREGAPRG